MTSNSEATSDNRTLAQTLSSVPQFPPAVLDKVANTGFGQRNPKWTTLSWNVPQMITALVLIEQSPAGKAWGVELAAIPSGTVASSDTRYTAGCSSYVAEAEAHVEWFFTRSKLSESAPMATVKWQDPTALTNTQVAGVAFSCNAILRMLYAAQELQLIHDTVQIKLEKDQRIAAMENKVVDLEERVAALSLELKQVTVNLRTHAPTVTCLMHLFAGYTMFTCSNCNPVSTDNDAGPSTHSTFNIAPHTDRLSDLSPEAQNWFLEQLDTRTVWVRATDPDSDDNHISWTQFDGAVEMGKSVAFSHGNYRFW